MRTSQATQNTYRNPELYRERTAIERTNAWLDSFKALLVGYETIVDN